MKSQPVVSTALNREETRLVIPSSLIVKVVSVYILFYCSQPYALSWTINPFLQGQEIYSDNINLAPSGNEKSAFVTEVNPGVSITGQSGRTNLNLNYRMQNLYNAGGNGGITISNQLQYNSFNTFIPNRLFLNSYSSISQQNLNSNQIGATNINGSGNSTTVTTFGLSPYWTPRFGSYANGAVQVNFNTVTTGNASSSNNNFNSSVNTISDSINLAQTVQLNSGAKFKRVNWGLSLNNSANYRVNSNTQNPSFQNANAIVRTYINTYFNVFAQGGYSNNSFQSTTDSNNSGFYYTFGGQWRPSQRYSIAVGAGNNSFVTVNVSPMQRLSWSTTYTNNAVGTNFGQYSGQNIGQTSGQTSGQNSGQNSGVNLGQNAGQTWQTALNYRTRRSTWSITRNNNTTTAQQILAQNQNQIFPAQNQPGGLVNNFVPNPRVINNPNLTNEVIVSKTWNFSVSFNTGKSTLSANAYDQDYEYQKSGNNQNTRGLSATWNWKFAARTSAYIRPLWQRTENQNSINNNQYYEVLIGVNRSITSRLNGSIDFRHGEQTTSGNTNDLQSLGVNANNFQPLGVNANDYQENRVTASLFMRF